MFRRKTKSEPFLMKIWFKAARCFFKSVNDRKAKNFTAVELKTVRTSCWDDQTGRISRLDFYSFILQFDSFLVESLNFPPGLLVFERSRKQRIRRWLRLQTSHNNHMTVSCLLGSVVRSGAFKLIRL